MKLLNYALMLLFTLGMLSCGGGGDDPDETDPTVTFNSPSPNSASPTAVTAGQNLSFNISLKDNDKLQSIIFNAPVTKSVNDFLSDFEAKLTNTVTSSASIVGKSEATVAFPVEVLAGAPPGVYTVTCVVKDVSDNSTTATAYFEVE